MPMQPRTMTEDEDRARLPVALLTGFLGSGKTTLLNALLRDPRLADTAVAINEFGEVPLDQHLIGHSAEKTVVMANGCLCCYLPGDLEDAVMRIFSRRQSGDLPQFSRLIVEPSGLADPAPLAQALLRNPVLSRFLRLETVLVTVDTLFGRQHLASQAESRKQVAMADRIILTKSDMAEPGEVEALDAELDCLNSRALRFDGAVARLDPSCLFPARFFDASAPTSSIATSLAEMAAAPVRKHKHSGHSHVDSRHAASSVSIVSRQALVWPEFEVWLRRIRLDFAIELLRFKGILNLAGCPRPLVVHGVHHVLHTPVELDCWPDADHSCRLVFIATGAVPGEIRARWDLARHRLLAPNISAHEGATP